MKDSMMVYNRDHMDTAVEVQEVVQYNMMVVVWADNTEMDI